MDRTITVSRFPELSLFKEDEYINTRLELIAQEEGVYEYYLELDMDEAFSPKPITISWKMPSLNVKGVWKSGGLHDKRQQYDWELEHIQSRISVNAPVISVFGHDDTNVITFACSDAINLIEMNALLREEDNNIYCHLTFFKERHPQINHYEAKIRVDMRSSLYSEALSGIADWWAEFETLTPASVPALARKPLYSTWYNFHQDLEEDTLLKECKLALDLGYELIIIDDGWQTMDTNRGYDYTGDWYPERFPEMDILVEKIQALGMKVGLWFSVPFCGFKSKAYERFKGKFLTENHRWAPVFDPRYPEVRQYLIDTYKNALINWNLDAFKLDFIDDFKVYPETTLSKENGRDFANVNEAVDCLMTDVMASLKAIKPDIAIEFRQQYVGPAMRKFGNMFRAFDCPNDAVSNRIRVTDVKLLCGQTAVHSDPQTWHPEEPVELAALQVLNGFFGVPQMSIFLQKASKQHLEMVKFYTDFWKKNAGVILDGDFIAQNPLANYPMLASYKDGHGIIGVYDDLIVDLQYGNKLDLINAKPSQYIVVRFPEEMFGYYDLITWDCTGKRQVKSHIQVEQSVFEITVSISGMASLIKK